MVKTTLREIRQSLGRYLAIMAIIALGVGFFAGLKATKPGMVNTVENYMIEQKLYDYRLLSTVGFEQEDIDYLQEFAPEAVVEPSITVDVLVNDFSSDNGFVLKTHSITEGVNEISLAAGRMPENANECVVDAAVYNESVIGKKLTFSPDNEEDTLGSFAYKEYKIVGIANSPLYIQFERGNTALGNGTVTGFAYLLPEGYDTEVFTEVYVKLDIPDYPLYDEEYEAYLESVEEEWQTALNACVERRYQDLFVELEDAKEEFRREKADAEKELLDAQIELEDAAKEMEDAEKELEDGIKELEDGKKKLADSKADLEEAEKKIAENEALLEEKKAELEEGKAEWEENYALVMAGYDELDMADIVIQSQEALLLSGKVQLLEVDILMNQMSGVYDILGQLMSEEDKEELEGSLAESEMGQQLGQLEEGKAKVQSGEAALNSAKQQMADARKELDDAYAQLMDAYDEILEGEAQLIEGELKLTTGKKELEDGKAQLADAEREMADAEKELLDGQKELEEGKLEYADGLKEYEDGVKEFEEEITDAEAEIADAEETLRTMKEPEGYILDRRTNVGYVCFESDSEIVENVADVFPVFFFLVAALVCMTTMNRMVEEQRTQIGTFKALGYSDGVIMAKYLFYSGSSALIGCLAGFVIGCLGIPRVIWIAYQMMYIQIPFRDVFMPEMLIFSVVVSLLCSAGTTYVCCRSELKEVAAQLMRPKTPKAGKRIFLEKLPFIWKRLGFLQKVSIRNVFRYKRRFFMMVIGISGCTALVLAGLGMENSVADVVTDQYEQIQTYDMTVSFSENLEGELLKELQEILEGKTDIYMSFAEGSYTIEFEEQSDTLTLVIPENPEHMAEFYNLHTLEKEPISFPQDGGIIITHSMADKLGIEIGDTIELVNDDRDRISAVVSGINRNFVFDYAYMTMGTYEKEMGEAAEYNTSYIKLSEEYLDSAHELSAEIMDLEEVTSVNISVDTQARFSSMMGSLDYIVLLVIGCAAALAFIVLYNLTNINITERVREIATIKVLGFYRNETASYVFRENLILTAVGAFVGLALGKILHAFVMSCIKVDMVSFDVKINPESYVYAVVLTFVFAFCVNKMMNKKLEDISMTESLKSVD
ncbi:MAG: ABC transporter permease [Lachnospiraceae bacterium]|nr:ABC transporter permease [Lachnospiraceae bacterium]